MICQRCKEPVLDTDKRSPAQLNGQPMHYECGLRMVIGSAAHIRGECSCYGGEGEDDGGREAAREAVREWEARKKARLPLDE